MLRVFSYIYHIAIYLAGLIIPVASFRIVSFAFLPDLKPNQLKADSAAFSAAFDKVGSVLSPMKHLASTVKFSNLTSTVGSSIPTLRPEKQSK